MAKTTVDERELAQIVDPQLAHTLFAAVRKRRSASRKRKPAYKPADYKRFVLDSPALTKRFQRFMKKEVIVDEQR